MRNWKTTFSGVVAAMPALLSVFGVELPPDVFKGVTALGLFLIGAFSKDHSTNG